MSAPIPTSTAGRRIEGRVTAVLRAADGTELTRREASNTVLRSGAELVAAVLTGQAGARALNGVTVGANGAPTAPPYALTGLSPTAVDGAVTGTLVVALEPSAFTVETQVDRLRVRIGARAVLPPGTGTGTIREAALGTLAEGGGSLATLYNRVILEPIEKASDQELTLYWDIFLPYGT